MGRESPCRYGPRGPMILQAAEGQGAAMCLDWSPLRRRAASAGSQPGRRAAARWHGWGVAPEGAGSLAPPGRAPQQGARRWVCGQTSASAGAGWQGVGERGRVGRREKWLCFSYTLPILLRGKQGTSQRQGWNLARDLAVGTNAGCACVSGPAPSPQPRRSPRRPASPKGSRK